MGAIEGKFKLSQNRSATDRAGVVAQLRASGTDNDAALAGLMVVAGAPAGAFESPMPLRNRVPPERKATWLELFDFFRRGAGYAMQSYGTGGRDQFSRAKRLVVM